VLAWVPTPVEHATACMGGVPDGARLEHWSGELPVPSSSAEVAILVPSPMYKLDDTASVLGSLPQLRLVQVLNAGYDLIVGAVPPHVTLSNAGDANAAAVADWVLSVILADNRHLDALAAQQREHVWKMALGPAMSSLRVLVLGFGSIGRAVGTRLAAFGCDVVPVVSRARDGMHGVDDLASLLPNANVLVVLAPLTEQTRGLVDAAVLAALPDGALVVNAARGPVLDQEALLAELQAGRLRAALDVTDPEPLPADHPLWDAPGLRITPHVGGATADFFRFTYPVVRTQIERMLAGEPPVNVVRAATP
jgi:phosphoglycerate dehydrogenase-like enzyme